MSEGTVNSISRCHSSSLLITLRTAEQFEQLWRRKVCVGFPHRYFPKTHRHEKRAGWSSLINSRDNCSWKDFLQLGIFFVCQYLSPFHAFAAVDQPCIAESIQPTWGRCVTSEWFHFSCCLLQRFWSMATLRPLFTGLTHSAIDC